MRYSNELSKLRLLTAARSWLDTPFVPHANIKGAGVDCVHLVVSIYLESGFEFAFHPPNYSIDGRHLSESKVVKWIEESQQFELVVESAIGDTLLFKVGPVEHHCGVKVTPATFIHAIRGHGVIESNVADPTWVKRLTRIYRPT